MYSIKSALRRSLSRLPARSMLPPCAGRGHPLPRLRVPVARTEPVPPARSPGQERSAGGQGASCSQREGVERGSPTGNLPALPGGASAGMRGLAGPGCPPAAAGRDCRAAERNQSREEANNLLCPRRRSSAALPQVLPVSLWRVASGKDESLKRGSFSYRKSLFQGVEPEISNADEHLERSSEKVQACCSTALTCSRGHPFSMG